MTRKEERRQASVEYHAKPHYEAIKDDFLWGAEWADKTVCEWLEDNIWNYIETKSLGDFEILKEVKVSEMVKDLRKAMEE